MWSEYMLKVEKYEFCQNFNVELPIYIKSIIKCDVFMVLSPYPFTSHIPSLSYVRTQVNAASDQGRVQQDVALPNTTSNYKYIINISTPHTFKYRYIYDVHDALQIKILNPIQRTQKYP